MENLIRQKKIIKTSIVGIIVNVFVAIMKIVVGAITSSMAIISEGMNNATDAVSSVLTLVGAKLSNKHPNEKHPFGYGRIEYITGLIISALISYMAITLAIESVKAMFEESMIDITILSIVLVVISAIIKFFLGSYTIKNGKDTNSSSLIAIGKECRNDCFFSVITVFSSVLFLLTDFSIDAYVGFVFALIILKNGISSFISTTSEIIGENGHKELADELYKEIRNTQGVINVADMMIHNYGKTKYSASANLEMDYKLTVGQVYETIHTLQLEIMKKYDVTMVFGIYAVNGDDKRSLSLRQYIAQFCKLKDHVLSYHAVFVNNKLKKIYCDLVVDYALTDWDKLHSEFLEYMQTNYPDYQVELTIETKFV